MYSVKNLTEYRALSGFFIVLDGIELSLYIRENYIAKKKRITHFSLLQFFFNEASNFRDKILTN